MPMAHRRRCGGRPPIIPGYLARPFELLKDHMTRIPSPFNQWRGGELICENTQSPTSPPGDALVVARLGLKTCTIVEILRAANRLLRSELRSVSLAANCQARSPVWPRADRRQENANTGSS